MKRSNELDITLCAKKFTFSFPGIGEEKENNYYTLYLCNACNIMSVLTRKYFFSSFQIESEISNYTVTEKGEKKKN